MDTKQAADLFGGIPQLAKELGITQSAIYQWGEKVPPLRAYQIRDLLAEKSLGDRPQKEAA